MKRMLLATFLTVFCLGLFAETSQAQWGNNGYGFGKSNRSGGSYNYGGYGYGYQRPVIEHYNPGGYVPRGYNGGYPGNFHNFSGPYSSNRYR